ncbi:MAG: patatin-like phospholipase family protein [Pseudomonadota bacterium]
MRALMLCLFVLSTAACATPRNLPAPPPGEHLRAEVVGFPGVRIWGDESPPDIDRRIGLFRTQTMARFKAGGVPPEQQRLDALVLSGGGSDGAYGAGLLKGWSARGTRPEFTFVTGVSTGALIAPFAFLGSDYDDELERFYTQTPAESLLDFTPLRALLGGLSLVDTTRAGRLLEELLSDEVVRQIGAEHLRGRRLWIGTTNLDAQRPVFWNIGAIAATGKPKAGDMIRRIMLASSAIPGAFPPQLFPVVSGGERYSELHLDGGVTHQLFLYPYAIQLPENTRAQIGPMLGTIYVLRNTQLAPDYEPVTPRVVDIAARSISTLIKTSGRNDVFALEAIARRDGFSMEVTAVPESFNLVEENLFDLAYMRALYDVGYRLGREGRPWTSVVTKETDEPKTLARAE